MFGISEEKFEKRLAQIRSEYLREITDLIIKNTDLRREVMELESKIEQIIPKIN